MLSTQEHIRRSVAESERLGRGTATAERIAKAEEGAFEETPKGIQRINAAPLDLLWKSGRLTRREFEAGDRFRADAYLAAIDPGAMTVDWNATGGGFSAKVPAMFTSQNMADARIRFRQIERTIRGVVWTVLSLGLIKELPLAELGRNVFGRVDLRDARAAGEAGLRVALGAVADRYEM